MAIYELTNLKQNIRSGQCLLGVDLGSKTIGLSLSDPLLIIASPLKTIRRTRFSENLALIKSIILELNIGGTIIGLPISLNGKEGPRCQSTRQFASNFLSGIDIPLAFWDERYSTAAVERLLISEADISRTKRSKIIDKIAATYILQGALDFINK